MSFGLKHILTNSPKVEVDIKNILSVLEAGTHPLSTWSRGAVVAVMK